MPDNDDNTKQDMNPALVLERTKAVSERFGRQKSYLMSLNMRLPLLKSSLEYSKKIFKEAGEDIARLEREIPAVEDHIQKLNTWLANNHETEDDVAVANALARRIQRLQKEIEVKRKQLHRAESGLPDID